MIRPRVVSIVQARVGGTRMPGKVLASFAGRTLLQHHMDRLRMVARLNERVVAIPQGEANDPLAQHCYENGWVCFRHQDEEDVLARYAAAARKYKAEVVVRTTADCPLIDPGVVAGALTMFLDAAGEFDYVSNNLEPTFPHGLDVEVFSRKALGEAHRDASRAFDREHVTEWIRRHQDRPYRLGNLRYPIEDVQDHMPSCPADCAGVPLPKILREARLTVDWPEDFLVVKTLAEFWGRETRFMTTADAVWLLHHVPDLMEVNRARAEEHRQLLAGAFEPISETGRAALTQVTRDALHPERRN